MNIDDLSSTGFFDADWDSRKAQIRERVAGKRLLVVGGAGSIGSSTIRELVAFRPDTLHVVDLNENSLVELVRDYRSGPHNGFVRDFRSLPLDFGSKIMGHFLDQESPYDLVLNFAALKHVRSEKDVWSILRMLERIAISKPFFPGGGASKSGPVGGRKIRTGESGTSDYIKGLIGKRSPFGPRSTPTACPRESPCYN